MSHFRFRKDLLKGGIFLLLALIVGYWANTFSEKEAILKWERTYFPSEQIISFALGSRKMTRLQNSPKLNSVLRTLPAMLDDPASLWSSSDSNWIAFYSNPDQLLEAQIYCLECSQPPPAKWLPMGQGWRALDQTMELLDKNLQKRPPKPKKAVVTDPRAILY